MCQEPFLGKGESLWYLVAMGRPKRAADGGLVYHVLNRSNARMPIFETQGRLRGVRAGAARGGRTVRDAAVGVLRRCVTRACPFGEAAWCDRMVRRLGLESTLRPQGRPKKENNAS